jgi:hypothetical protein
MDDAITNSGLVFTIGLTGHRDIHPDAVAEKLDPYAILGSGLFEFQSQ